MLDKLKSIRKLGILTVLAAALVFGASTPDYAEAESSERRIHNARKQQLRKKNHRIKKARQKHNRIKNARRKHNANKNKRRRPGRTRR